MGIEATVTLTCDKCETEMVEDLEPSQSPEDMADSQGWYRTGTLLEGLLCEDCYDPDTDL